MKISKAKSKKAAFQLTLQTILVLVLIFAIVIAASIGLYNVLKRLGISPF